MDFVFRVRGAWLALGAVVVVTGLALTSVPAGAAEATYLSQYIPTGDRVNDLEADGTRRKLFVVVPHGVLVFDTKKVTPLLIGQYRLNNEYGSRGAAVDLALSGTTGYLVRQDVGLDVLRLGAPSVPSRLGRVDLSCGGSVAATSTHAFVVCNSSNRLQVVDATDPTKPSLAATVTLSDAAEAPAISGNYLYLPLPGSAVDKGQLAVYDISTPASPRLVGSVETNGQAIGVTIAGSKAYVADGSAGVTVVDVSTPTAPAVLGSLVLRTSFTAYVFRTSVMEQPVFGDGPVVFAQSENRLFAVQASDPTAMTELWSLAAKNSFEMIWDGWDVFFSEGKEQDLVSRVDPAINPYARKKGATFSVQMRLIDTVVNGDTAYALDGSLGLHVIDVLDPSNPIFRGFADVPGPAGNVSALAVQDHHAFVAAKRNGLQIFSVGVQTNPRIQGSYAKPGLVVWDVALKDTFAFLAAGSDGLIVLDISTPYKPKKVASRIFDREIRKISIDGDSAYLLAADRAYQVRIFDADMPELQATAKVSLVDAKVDGDLVVGLRAAGRKLQLYRLGQTGISRLGSYTLTGAGRSLEYANSRAYTANGSAGVQVIDLQDPAVPTLITTVKRTSMSANAVWRSGTNLYVADKTGLLVFDVAAL